MIFGIDDPTFTDRTALIDGASGEQWTYQRLCDEVRIRQKALSTARKSLVFHFCYNDADSVAWYLSAIEAGQAIGLFPGSLDASLRDRLFAAFDPDFVMCREHPGTGYAATSSVNLWRRAEEREYADLPDGLCLLLSTSGSTGSPKLVRLSRSSVEANARSIQQALELTPADRPVAHLPLSYSYGLSIVNSHLLVAACIVLTGESLISESFWKMVKEHRVNSFSGVPYTYQMLRRLDIDRLPAESIVTMTQAGGKLDDQSILHFHKKMEARGGRFWVMYGQTEAVARIAILPASKLPELAGSAGKAIPLGSLSIDTDGGETTEPSVPGELIYRGPNVMWGYALSREDLAKGDELQGVLATGDRARLDGAGYVYILGRSKRDAKIFGLRINMDDLETLLKVNGPTAVVNGGNKLIVYCEFGDDVELKQLQASTCLQLKLHGSSMEFRRIGKLPTTASGKIDYSQLEPR
jgi:acyl-CoA synthetase (AMP-forming)/AMP-acid ligase II